MSSAKAPRYVTYLRVSTAQQGASGLGLEAQQEMCARHVEASNGEILASFVEIESGGRSDRPELKKALALAKREGAALLVAKLDRLARSVAFVSRLIEAGTDFRAADAPAADKTMIQMLSVMSEWERDQISKRTRDALAAAKARGQKLGNPNKKTLAANMAAGRQQQAQEAQERAKDLAPVVQAIKAAGIATLAGIAEELNRRQIHTPRGGQWHASSVRNLIARLG